MGLVGKQLQGALVDLLDGDSVHIHPGLTDTAERRKLSEAVLEVGQLVEALENLSPVDTDMFKPGDDAEPICWALKRKSEWKHDG